MNVFKNRKIILVAIAVLWITPNQTSFGQTHKTGASKASGASEHVNRGADLAAKGQYDEAIAEFTKAIEANPKKPMYYNNRGNVYRAAEKLPEAIADFSKSIELAPQDVTGYFERGQTEVMLARKETDQKKQSEQYAAGVADLDKAIALKPDDATLYRNRGFAQVGMSDWDKAIADFSKAVEKDSDGKPLLDGAADLTNFATRKWLAGLLA
jgi:Flp pilus assembly protein TadD